ncbi:hypothetical protein O181_024093 [Austropuccinia psidii MF-1]|uniref:Reverse transcriptase RNase H-like domain-containing protein n=1 Tax=Austropuccinia psidii MF-1 TaxID=1389203 RepID=A0A9Q3CK35_9BASI|nr:hypothetical protein [Austropuccinia psidii MF-1]
MKLAIDSSYIAAGAAPMKEDKNEKDRKVLYQSVKLFILEYKYSQQNLELFGVARILKKPQTILWGKQFELQLYYKDLIEIINTFFLLNTPMKIWVAFIKLFSFDLIHKPGRKFTMPDRLSRSPEGEEKEESERDDFDEVEDWIKPHPGFGLKEVKKRKVGSLSRNESNIEIQIKQEGFGKHMQEYLKNLKNSEIIGAEYFNKIQRRSVNFYL